MSSWNTIIKEEFDGLGGVWLNTAHQGPLPDRAVRVVREAAARKADPSRIADTSFSDVPEALRRTLARLIGASPDEIVLGNSTSHGLHLIANGLDWQPGDEVITVRGDYPATVLPWRRLEGRGVVSREVGRDDDGLIDIEALSALLGPRTRLVAVTWVDSFSGVAEDVAEIGRRCREHDVWCVVNGAQAVGARLVEVDDLGIDALVSCGYKWLCGPYGTGFTWLKPALRDRLDSHQAYWLAHQSGSGLEHMRDHTLRDDLGVRGFDVFCPANFLNFEPWLAALELILELGCEAVERHDRTLVECLLSGIDPRVYAVRGPNNDAARSTLVVLDRHDGKVRPVYERLAGRGIATALREGAIRFSPHLFTTEGDIDAALAALHD